MMKFILSAIAAFGLFMSALGSDTQSLFAAKEVSVSLGTGYVVDYHAKTIKGAFAQPYDLNINAGAQYFITKNIGVEFALPFYQTKGVSISEVQFGTVARLPVFKHLAPYVGVGGLYDWQSSQRWEYIAKAGVEWRFNPKWSIYTQAEYRNADLKLTGGATSIGAGIRLVF